MYSGPLAGFGFDLGAAWEQDRLTIPAAEGLDYMNVIRSLWASIQGDPTFMRRVNGWLTVFWLAMIPVSLVTGWISSVTYVAALSLWALVSGHWSTWQAARVEVRQDEEARRAENAPIEDRVVDRLVETTAIDRVSAGH